MYPPAASGTLAEEIEFEILEKETRQAGCASSGGDAEEGEAHREAPDLQGEKPAAAAPR
jgi:hypothetical protein